MTSIKPTLYKKTSTGAQQEWTIRVHGNTIVTFWGQMGGAMQSTHDEIKVGKNIGKKNETTPEEQAMLEAQAQWEKKLKKGYNQIVELAMAGEVDAIIEGGISPMLAHRFDEQGHKIKFPAFAQPKLDGHRCIAILKDGQCTLWSRTRKRITGVPHIQVSVERMGFELYGSDTNFVLDGELYNHAYRTKFEELTSFIRQETPKPGHEVVEYHIYDTPSCQGPFSARLASLRNFMVTGKRGFLHFVETTQVADEDELWLAFNNFVEQGYEGLMVRNADGRYVNKRSNDLQKVKEFQDMEFKVTGVEEGRGKLAGHAIFVCETRYGATFRAKLKGETSRLKEYFDHPETAIGKWLTVKFQGFTKDLIPRFPVGVRFRDEL